MGKKQIFKNGKWVDLPEDSDLVKQIKEFESKPLIAFGQVVQYKKDGALYIGKITGADKKGNIVVAKTSSHTKSGYQFSATDKETILQTDIVRQIN